MTTHTKLFGSTSKRTLGCPAHYQRGLHVPEPPTSDAAIEGSMLHSYAEAILQTDAQPHKFPWFNDLDDDQRNIVSTYVNLVREVAEGGRLSVEKRTVAPHLHPEWFGTADAVVVKPPRLTIADLKCGRVPVEAEEADGSINPQLGSYAISVLSQLKPAVRALITEVEIIIVQPRQGGIKRKVVTLRELDELKDRLLAAAALAESDNPPAAVGEWCHFCKVKPVCPTQRDFVLEQAKVDFALDGGDPTDLRPAELHSVLAVANVAIEWGKAVIELAERRLHEGDPLDGNWELVPKKARREWTDERLVKQRLLSEGLDFEEITEEILLSPARIDTLLKAKKMKLDLSDLHTSVSSGLKIAKKRNNDNDDDHDAGW